MSQIQAFFAEIHKIFASLKFPSDYIDIILVAVLIYYCIKFLSETRSGSVVKGILLLFVAFLIAKWLQLNAISYIIDNTVQLGFLAVIVVFQPELRSALEKVGRTNFKSLTTPQGGEKIDSINNMIDETVDSINDMSKRKIGALIVFENNTRLGEVIKTGISLNCDFSSQTVVTVFFPKSPLHDGAMIVRDCKILAAGCLLPLTQQQINKALGTRHRAAVGMSEISDALVVVVSEETGRISYAQNGNITTNVKSSEIANLLRKLYLGKDVKTNKFFRLFKNKKENKNEK